MKLLPLKENRYTVAYKFLVTLIAIFPYAMLAQYSLPISLQYVSPVPGSSMNSQHSTIIIRRKRSDDGDSGETPIHFTVQGLSSGTHTGRIIYAENGNTIIFKPDQPFSAGESVTVSVESNLLSTNTDRDSMWTFSFRVSRLSLSEQRRLAREHALSDILQQTNLSLKASRVSDQWHRMALDSLPSDFPLPAIVKSDSPSTEPIFLSSWRAVVAGNHLTYDSTATRYLMIIDNKDSAIFYRKTPAIAFDFKVLANGNLSYYDESVDMFYEMDTNYSIIDSFQCMDGYTTDQHDIRLLPDGRVLLIGADPEPVDMSAIVPGGNSSAIVIGAVLQEIDKNKNVVFEWRSFDHFQITDATHEDLTASTIDYVHANAVEVDTDGNILLSSRHMDEITKIDEQTGNIIWRWGGKNNQFTFVNDTLGFSHQHSINRTTNGTFILFDNGNFHTPQFSRALEYRLNQQAKTATLIWQYRHSPDTYTFAMGSVERLPNGNTFIGWGANNSVSATEVRPDDSVAYEIVLPDSLVSYRAFRFHWPPSRTTTVVVGPTEIPSSFQLSQNYPNPFNPSTTISFNLLSKLFVTLKIYDLLGREVTTLVSEELPAGAYNRQWNAKNLSSGVYFYRLTSGNFAETKKLVLLR